MSKMIASLEKLAMSNVIRNALGGIFVSLRILIKSVELFRYDFVLFMCGCKSLSRKAEAVCLPIVT